jgi:outer membrane protein assembly factor BamA
MGDFLNELLNKKLRILEELGHFKKVNLDFYPGENKNDIVVVCDLKEKTRFYLTASHTLSNHGGASFTTTGGLRNIFGYMDKF